MGGQSTQNLAEGVELETVSLSEFFIEIIVFWAYYLGAPFHLNLYIS